MHSPRAQNGTQLEQSLLQPEGTANEIDAEPIADDQSQQLSRRLLESRIAAHSERRKLSARRTD